MKARIIGSVVRSGNSWVVYCTVWRPGEATRTVPCKHRHLDHDGAVKGVE